MEEMLTEEVSNSSADQQPPVPSPQREESSEAVVHMEVQEENAPTPCDSAISSEVEAESSCVTNSPSVSAMDTDDSPTSSNTLDTSKPASEESQTANDDRY